MLQNVNKQIFNILLPGLLLLIPFPALRAQTVLLDPPEIYIGATGGMTGSMVMFNPKVNQSMPLLAYNGGLSIRYVTESHCGLQIEANYSQRGWEEAGGNYSRRADYVEFPLLTHLYWGKTNRFIFNLGPKLSYLLKETDLINTVAEPQEQQKTPIYNPFDYGIAAGFGYNLHTRKAGVFQLETRAYYGLSNIFADAKTDYFKASNFLNVSVSLGYYFQLTGKKD
jgi:hypothetical protein